MAEKPLNPRERHAEFCELRGSLITKVMKVEVLALQTGALLRELPRLFEQQPLTNAVPSSFPKMTVLGLYRPCAK